MMHQLHEYSNGSPCLFFEKERLTGVHFHERLASSNSGMTTGAIPESQQYNKPRNGGTGVYFENSELTPAVGCLHPLHHHDATCTSQHEQYRQSSTMMTPVPCPVGQPLYAPPILATTLQLLDEQKQQQEVQPTPFLALPYDPRVQQLQWPVKCSAGGDLFCETKRTAMRQKLHSRDYRLSTDELTFVEAAVKLSKGCSVQAPTLPSSPAHSPKILSKPALPHYVIRYSSTS